MNKEGKYIKLNMPEGVAEDDVPARGISIATPVLSSAAYDDDDDTNLEHLSSPVEKAAAAAARAGAAPPVPLGSSGGSGSGGNFTLGPLSIPEAKMKSVSCVVMVIQAVTLVLFLKRAQAAPAETRFINTTAIVLSELVKFCVCLYIVYAQETSPNMSLGSRWAHVWSLLTGDRRALLLIGVPAALYALQNNLTFVGVANLPATVYQIVAQVKVLTTALFSVVLLGRSISGFKWVSLLILMLGVAIVQVGPALAAGAKTSAASSAEAGDPVLGFVAILLAATISGFAGVFLEKLLKDPSVTIWQRNVQLAFFGVISASLMCVASDLPKLRELGFFHGYSPLVAAVVVNHALGGLVVALVVKYADNLVKGFAVSLSIILCATIFVVFYGNAVTVFLLGGGFLVLLSSWMYSLPDAPAAPAPAVSSSNSSNGNGNGTEMATRGTSRSTGEASADSESGARGAIHRVVAAVSAVTSRHGHGHNNGNGNNKRGGNADEGFGELETDDDFAYVAAGADGGAEGDGGDDSGRGDGGYGRPDFTLGLGDEDLSAIEDMSTTSAHHHHGGGAHYAHAHKSALADD